MVQELCLKFESSALNLILNDTKMHCRYHGSHLSRSGVPVSNNLCNAHKRRRGSFHDTFGPHDAGLSKMTLHLSKRNRFEFVSFFRRPWTHGRRTCVIVCQVSDLHVRHRHLNIWITIDLILPFWHMRKESISSAVSTDTIRP